MSPSNANNRHGCGVGNDSGTRMSAAHDAARRSSSVSSLANRSSNWGRAAKNSGSPVANGAGKRAAICDAVERLIEILETLPEGTTELGCHPGVRRDAQGMYVAEREQEVATVCDPRVRAAIDASGIELISFREAV